VRAACLEVLNFCRDEHWEPKLAIEAMTLAVSRLIVAISKDEATPLEHGMIGAERVAEMLRAYVKHLTKIPGEPPGANHTEH